MILSRIGMVWGVSGGFPPLDTISYSSNGYCHPDSSRLLKIPLYTDLGTASVGHAAAGGPRPFSFSLAVLNEIQNDTRPMFSNELSEGSFGFFCY